MIVLVCTFVYHTSKLIITSVALHFKHQEDSQAYNAHVHHQIICYFGSTVKHCAKCYIQYRSKGLQHAVSTHLTSTLHPNTRMRVIIDIELHAVDVILLVKLHAVFQLELIKCMWWELQTCQPRFLEASVNVNSQFVAITSLNCSMMLFQYILSPYNDFYPMA